MLDSIIVYIKKWKSLKEFFKWNIIEKNHIEDTNITAQVAGWQVQVVQISATKKHQRSHGANPLVIQKINQ